MQTEYDPNLKANLTIDDQKNVRSINHFEEYWLSEKQNPIEIATDYFNHIADLIKISKKSLKNMYQNVSYTEPREQGIEYRLSEEKQFFDSITFGFYQTFLNVPVWQAGLTVTLKSSPYRIITAVNTSQQGFDAKLPVNEKIEQHKKMFNQASIENYIHNLDLKDREKPSTSEFIRKLIDTSKLQEELGEIVSADNNKIYDNARMIRGRFFVYRYDEKNRRPTQKPTETMPEEKNKDREQFESEYEPTLPLPPVDESIKDGQYYLVSEITFSFATTRYGKINWLALVEVKTDSVLYLRALSASVNGKVFLQDPISKTGVATNTPDKSNAVLLPFRDSVVLPNLNAPVAGKQSLQGTYANLTDVEIPNILPHTSPVGTDFIYDVRTDDFAAVNAYYHVDRFFSLVSSLGFPLSTYFSHTTFPIPVDHRGRYLTTDGIEVNAHCEGNGTGGIGYVGYCLSDTSNIINPIGISLDWRIHLHELGGHGVLYEHVNSPNFGFAHSAGDSISLIINDPDSHAPDRFRLFPWINIIRRCDRDITSGWAWGGSNDTGGYNSEEILETTLFRAYRSIGGDVTADLGRRRFASRLMVYLILRAISTLTPATNPSNAIGFANALMTVDLLNWTTEGVYGGAYNKVIRWSFEKQGLYQAPGSLPPVTTPGSPPAVDVYIDDGRHGEYTYQNIHWNNISVWNRRASDGLPAHQEAALGVSNYAYVKIKNRGTQTANNVKIKGYHCRPSAGVLWPNDFQPFTTAEISVGTLAPNNTEEKIVGPFEWTPITNAFGHDCMLMIASADNDSSNIDNFTTGENIADWRLVPNDNNVGQRNVVLVPGGGGGEGLMNGLHGYQFWIGNPLIKKATMKLQVHLPDLLANNNWKISFKDIKENHLEIQSGKQQEIVIEIQQGKDFTVQDIEKSKDKDIVISVYADDILIGGMTYRLDPKIKEPFNKPKQGPGDKKGTKCHDKAQELLKCMDLPDQKVKNVCVKKITLDIDLDDKCDC